MITFQVVKNLPTVKQNIAIEKTTFDKAKAKKYIEKKAYGAMKLDIMDKLRNIEYQILINQKPPKEMELLKTILSTLGLVFFVFVLMTIYAFFGYLFYKINKNHTNSGLE